MLKKLTTLPEIVMQKFLLPIVLPLLLWLALLGLSSLVQSFGWTDQGKAFLYIILIVATLFTIIEIVLSAILEGNKLRNILVSVFTLLLTFSIQHFTAWLATKLCGIDFYTAHMLINLGSFLGLKIAKKQAT